MWLSSHTFVYGTTLYCTYLHIHTKIERRRVYTVERDMLGVQLSLILVALAAFSSNSEIGDSGLARLQFRCSYSTPKINA